VNDARAQIVHFVAALFSGDLVATGIVERLDRPGGNVTGFAVFEASLAGKWLELLSEIAPGLKRAAIMFNPDTSPASIYNCQCVCSTKSATQCVTRSARNCQSGGKVNI
jgi:hypothetical protein